MSDMVPMYGFGGGGSVGKTVTVHVTPETGANVTCTNGKDTFTGTTNGDGNTIFKLKKGPWTITAEKSGVSVSKNVSVAADCTVEIDLNRIPAFTYTGTYEIVNDKDNVITSTLGNWKIRFLTSGTLKFTNLRGAANGIDVFLVGGGGGCGINHTSGAAGGYTKTKFGVQVQTNIPYSIAVGAGGSSDGGNGGDTSAFGNTANGGGGCRDRSQFGGNGGSGGGLYEATHGLNGGSDGSDGYGADETHGKGQGTSTREFEETDGTLYAGGGGGGSVSAGDVGKGGAGGGADGLKSASPNTGGGAGGGIDKSSTGRNGGSGIVIIRSKR